MDSGHVLVIVLLLIVLSIACRGIAL